MACAWSELLGVEDEELLSEPEALPLPDSEPLPDAEPESVEPLLLEGVVLVLPYVELLGVVVELVLPYVEVELGVLLVLDMSVGLVDELGVELVDAVLEFELLEVP